MEQMDRIVELTHLEVNKVATPSLSTHRDVETSETPESFTTHQTDKAEDNNRSAPSKRQKHE